MAKTFDKLNRIFGCNAAVAKIGEDAVAKVDEDDETPEDQSENKTIFYELLKYSMIPTSCCQLDWHTQRFQRGAAMDLKEIERALDFKDYAMVGIFCLT